MIFFNLQKNCNRTVYYILKKKQKKKDFFMANMHT